MKSGSETLSCDSKPIPFKMYQKKKNELPNHFFSSNFLPERTATEIEFAFFAITISETASPI